ncbi:hypothetical protein [Staphylococcus ratti]|uniref:Uncharacterized protein n=1 Tax=Staphylococcus ratti TaxID=2892440 RepID=A0ABY3PE52_9STAP|nr:hypothetical protein [Staphylococcus ratti]UEX90514.1 hypothetical protein LN051_02275 [Staphylococcus ratti]
MVIKLFHNYFITLTIFLTMVILSFGFVNQFENGLALFVVLMVVLTALNFTIETWLLKATLTSGQMRLVQTIAFPFSIIVIGLTCFIMMM